MKLFDDVKFLDIQVTNRCNFGCTYCIQKHDQIDFDLDLLPDLNRFIKKIIDLNPKSKFLIVGLWGGEPLISERVVTGIVECIKECPVEFLFFTNGLYVPKYIDFFKEVLKTNKINVQVSFDGIKHQEIFRNHCKEVLKSIFLLDQNNIPFTLKATITLKGIKYLYDTILSYMVLRKTLRTKISLKITFDYMSEYIYNISDSEFEKHLLELENQIRLIKKTFKKTDLKFFNLVYDNKAICSVGRNLFSVSANGNVVLCHGALELCKDFPEFIVGHIKNDLIFEKISIIQRRLQHVEKFEHPECKVCSSRVCLRCNVVNYSKSNLDSFERRMYDKNFYRVCLLYKTCSKLHWEEWNND